VRRSFFSCVDGEIARIQGRSSRIGDFLDTLTDRVVERLLRYCARPPFALERLYAPGGN
jgi:phosphatidylglycerophosphate synthase